MDTPKSAGTHEFRDAKHNLSDTIYDNEKARK